MACNDCQEGKAEVPARVSKSFAKPGDAERLAGRSSANKVNWLIHPPFFKLRHVAKIRHVGIVMRQHRARKRLDFRKPHRPPAQRFPRHACRLDARADGKKIHCWPLIRFDSSSLFFHSSPPSAATSFFSASQSLNRYCTHSAGFFRSDFITAAATIFSANPIQSIA